LRGNDSSNAGEFNLPKFKHILIIVNLMILYIVVSTCIHGNDGYRYLSPPFRWEGIVAVGVFLPYPSVVSVNQEFTLLIPRDGPTGLDCLFLDIVKQGAFGIPCTLDGSAIPVWNAVLILSHELNSLKYKLCFL
jgi:hypothetical protein